MWTDGIYLTPRREDAGLCLLILIGVNEPGEKRLLALSNGYRESQASWLNVILELQEPDLKTAP